MRNQVTATPAVVLAIGVALFSGSMGIYLVPIQIGALMDGLGFTASHAGVLGSLEVASMSLTAIAIAPSLARWPRSVVAATGAVLAGAGEIASGFAGTFALFIPLRILVGAGCGLLFGCAAAASASTTRPDSNFAWGQAVMNLLFMSLFLVAPFALGFGQHRGLFLLLGAVLIAVTPLYRALPAAPQSPQRTGAGAPNMNLALVALHILATMLLNVGLGALWGFAERIGTRNVGLSIEIVGTVLSIATLFMIFGSLFAGWLGVRWGRGRPMAAAAVVCAASALLIAHAETLWEFASGLFAYNAAYLFLGPYIIAGTSSALDHSGRLASVIAGVMFLSYSAGIAAGGVIAEQVGLSGIGWLAFVTCLAAAPIFAYVSRQTELTRASL